MNQKYNGLQILRAIAAWVVVFHHIDQSIYERRATSAFWLFFREYGGFGVEVFFVLSGFIMFHSVSRSQKSGIRFFFDRLFRIIPVYWVMTILLIICSAALPTGSYNTFYNTETLIKSFLLIPSENLNEMGRFPFLYVGWTLIFEMFFYCALSFFLIVKRKHAILFTFISLSILPLAIIGKNFLGNNTFLLYMFSSGMAIAYVYKLIANKINKQQSGFIILGFIAISAATLYFFGWNFSTKLVLALYILLIFLFIEQFLNLKSKITIFSVHLGDISYSTYLVHPIVFGLFRVYFRNVDSILIEAAVVSSIAILVYALSNLGYIYIERNKAINNLKNKLSDIVDNSPIGMKLNSASNNAV